MASLLQVEVDASQLERWASELSARGMRNAIRRAVDQSARAARKTAIDMISRDIGVSAARFKDATPKVKASTAGSLTATWTISKAKIGILNVADASVSKGGGLSASTFRLTSGGSKALQVCKAFLVTTAAGGRFVAVRRPGVKRLPIKSIYAETPKTAMGQDGAAARVAWQKDAEKEIAARLPVEIGKQLVAERLGPSSPIND